MEQAETANYIGVAVRPANNTLINYLATNTNFVIADLYTFALTSGAFFRWSGFQTSLIVPATVPSTADLVFADGKSLNNITSGSLTFVLGPKFGRSKIETRIGVSPNELDLSIYAGIHDMAGAFPIANAFYYGLFDGATVELDRYYMNSQTMAPLGAITWFYGVITDTDVGRTKIDVKIKSLMQLLAVQQMPRRLCQSACANVFGDAMCLFDRTTRQTTATCLTGSNPSQLLTSITPSPLTLYDQGTAVGLTGQNTGQTRTINRIVSGAITFRKNLLFNVAVGDTFNLLPGCDHTVATCNNVFNNLIHYGGQPYIPPPEFAI